MTRIAVSQLAAMALYSVLLHAEDAPAKCSLQTLKGSYGLALSGTRPAPAVLPNSLALPGAMEQVIGVVIHIFDGNGGFTQTGSTVKGSLSGANLDAPGSGTYTVNADCTGTFTVNNTISPVPLVNRFIITDGGKEIRSVVVSPQPVMVTSVGRKVD